MKLLVVLAKLHTGAAGADALAHKAPPTLSVQMGVFVVQEPALERTVPPASVSVSGGVDTQVAVFVAVAVTPATPDVVVVLLMQ